MKRRQATAMLGAAWTALPLVVCAQQPALPVVGFLCGSSADAWTSNLAAFRDGLKEEGYIEGQNVVLEYRWAEGRYERLQALATDLVRRRVAVIAATGGPPPIRAAMAASKTIPIVFTSGADPVMEGFVASLSRPGGNATGVTLFTTELIAKRVELLGQVAPEAKTMALLANPNSPSAAARIKEAQAAVRSLGLQVQVASARAERDLDAVVAALDRLRPVTLFIVTDPFFESRRAQIVRLAAQHGIPAIYQWREDAEAGGLMSYGTSITNMYRQAGVYAARILKGAKPSELPVLQPTRFELVINLKAAKALGLAIPKSLLLRADEVIQ